MHKYNLLYTVKFIRHVLTPESYKEMREDIHKCGSFFIHILLRGYVPYEYNKLITAYSADNICSGKL